MILVLHIEFESHVYIIMLKDKVVETSEMII